MCVGRRVTLCVTPSREARSKEGVAERNTRSIVLMQQTRSADATSGSRYSGAHFVVVQSRSGRCTSTVFIITASNKCSTGRANIPRATRRVMFAVGTALWHNIPSDKCRLHGAGQATRHRGSKKRESKKVKKPFSCVDAPLQRPV